MLQRPVKRPRHVLMTLDAVGGVWRYSLDLCRALQRKGVHFLLVGLGPEPSQDQWDEVRSVRNADLVWLDIPLDWQASSGAQLETLPDWLDELVRRWDIDLVHLNLPSQAAGLRVGCPVVVASHSCLATWWHTMRTGPLLGEWQWNYEYNRRGFEAADVILTPSQSHARAVAQVYGLPASRIITVHNGTDLPVRLPRKANLVFAAGRWWDDGKNGTVIDAAAEFCDWPVFMAGPLERPGGQALRLRHACPLGERRSEDIRRVMGRASIFVSSSLFEPFGLAVLEAAAARAALVLSDIPTFRELWDGAAVFVDPQDSAALAAAINRLVRNRRERHALGNAARSRAESYSLDAQASAMLELYAKAALHRSDTLTPSA